MFLCGFPFFFSSVRDGKTCLNTKTNDFNQQMACGAPIYWSKYTTQKCNLCIKVSSHKKFKEENLNASSWFKQELVQRVS